MPKSQEKLSTILLHDPTAGGPPAPNYLVVSSLALTILVHCQVQPPRLLVG